MKEFACGSVVDGCQAKFEGETDDEILGQVAEHAKADHDIDEPTPELVAAVKENITESE